MTSSAQCRCFAAGSVGDDGDAAWQHALKKAHKLALRHMPSMAVRYGTEIPTLRWIVLIGLRRTGAALPYRDAQGDTGFPDTCPSQSLREWIFDSNLTRLPNNETRGHIEEDIARYLYAATYASASSRSPRAQDFPRALAARHRSWNTGKFD